MVHLNGLNNALLRGMTYKSRILSIKIMGDPVVIRGWNIASLPTD
jgi:hypothetical protein